MGVDLALMALAIDLFCGLGGWSEAMIAEGYDVIGFDIERHEYGNQRYPGQLVLQDVLTLHGSQFKDAALIVASPPCVEYSYMAMPWSRAKRIAAALRGKGEFPEGYKGSRTIADLNALFDACFRIQREACEAAGRHVPLIVENVRGAVPWVGREKWNFGSFYLWGDVPALMPTTVKAQKFNPDGTSHGKGSWFAIADSKNRGSSGQKVPGFRFDGSGKSFQTASVRESGHKSQGMNWSDRSKRGQDFTRVAGKQAMEGLKVPSGQGRRTDPGKGARFTSRDCGDEGRKGRESGAAWFDKALDERRRAATAIMNEGQKVGEKEFAGYGGGFGWDGSPMRQGNRKSPARKASSALIAKIPEPLARHIAVTFKPKV